jgi:hypothetical protein
VDTDVLDRWPTWYPDAAPLGFLLREVYSDRWLRIHSLPNAKRYPTSGFEYAELLRRHYAVADDVIGSGERCAILLAAPCDGGASVIGVAEGLTKTGLPRLGALPLELSAEDTGVFGAPMCLYGAEATWQRGRFDRLITEVAEDRRRGLVVNLDTGRAYVPYDGGADLFYVTEDERDRARDRFRDWLSLREDGL